ncbi:hypothetical protein SBA7_1400003 [Candidatus Sulfotelmatobacter sp. SbA7]|nr:hypothetical protein SBA7_1400003 [Candidatus Sulfotelmatobacter sp. SbA7]
MSDPIASKAITLGMERRRELGLLCDLDHFAALVRSAFRASAVRHFLLVAVRTLRKRVLGKRVMRPPRGGALL